MKEKRARSFTKTTLLSFVTFFRLAGEGASICSGDIALRKKGALLNSLLLFGRTFLAIAFITLALLGIMIGQGAPIAATLPAPLVNILSIVLMYAIGVLCAAFMNRWHIKHEEKAE